MSGNTIKATQNLIFTQVSEHTLDYMHEWFGLADALNSSQVMAFLDQFSP